MNIKYYKRIYHVTVIKNIESPLKNIILNTHVFDNITESKAYAIDIIRNTISKDFNVSNLLLPLEIEKIVEKAHTNGIDYAFCIETISPEQKIFNYSSDLMEYFTNNIKSISNEELFDFLLSFTDRKIDWFDCIGRYKFGTVIPQKPILQNGFSYNIDFNENDCLNGIYTFEYAY